MIAQLPTLLALLGTGLLAVAIFAPPRAVGPAVSFAPPVATVPEPVVAAPSSSEPDSFELDPFELDSFGTATVNGLAFEPGWPVLVDPRAAGCDAAARAALAEALVAVGAPWAEAILHHAALEERDPGVCATLAAAGYLDPVNVDDRSR